MINIPRSKCPPSLELNLLPHSKGETETRSAITHHDRLRSHITAPGSTRREEFIAPKAYREKGIREALRKMFFGKCAYCESKITTIYDGDVEHFRPKGAVINSAKNLRTQGYYWLAADWENLLFACPFCNQTRTHVILNNSHPKEVTIGKANQFPLASETNRLGHEHGRHFFNNWTEYSQRFNLEEIDRLLLNPCKDPEIERYFEYTDNGEILPQKALNKLDHTKAATSIEVYALQRIGLVQARKERLVRIKAQICLLERSIKRFNDVYYKLNEERVWAEGKMRHEMQTLKAYMSETQEYAGMARYIINKYFVESGFTV